MSDSNHKLTEAFMIASRAVYTGNDYAAGYFQSMINHVLDRGCLNPKDVEDMKQQLLDQLFQLTTKLLSELMTRNASEKAQKSTKTISRD